MSTTAAPAAAPPEQVMTQNVMIPSFFEKLASLQGVTPADEAQARQMMLAADKIAYAVATTYEHLYSPRARLKAALDATGAAAAAEAQPAPPAAGSDAAAFLADPAVKAACEALAAATGGRS